MREQLQTTGAVFDTTDKSKIVTDNNNEQGWAATLAYQVELSPHVRWAVEGLRVWSDRPSRTDTGEPSEQARTTLQSSVRVSF